MKTKFYWVALLASAALIAQANAGGHHGGGGGFGGGGRAGAVGGGARASSFGPRGSFGGGRFMGPGARFSSYHAPMGFQQQRFGGSDRAFGRSGQFAARTANRRFDGSRTFNRGENRFMRNGNNFGNRFENRGANGAREHLFARRSADWHRDWDRNRDHFWRGHRCRFVSGEWFIFDTGFDPYNYWYPYGYPYNYYPYDYYPDSYYPGDDGGIDANYYGGSADGGGTYDYSDQSTDSTVAAAQEQLAGQGYYRGAVDGVFGAETRRAIMRYQSDHGLGATGRLNTDTLRALGLPRVASN
jgi:hypothetical protein